MSGRFQVILRIAVVVSVVTSVWIPVWLHYDIDRKFPPKEIMESAKTVPDTRILSEIGRMTLGIPLLDSATAVIPAAEEILNGGLFSSAFNIGITNLQGYPDDMRGGPPSFQLAKAGFGIESILLDAFEMTNDLRYLEKALVRIKNFSEYENRRRINDGFLWNDHAIAARVPILVRLWMHVRDRPDLEIKIREALFGLIVRSGRLLAKPSHFTVRTNHGVMQNIALLQLATAFPSLPDSPAWKNLALERLAIQLPFYVSTEGVTLEHSAEYHRLGYELLLMIARLYALNGLSPSQELAFKIEKAREFLELLKRPDGTLPAVGNTRQGTQYSFPSGLSNGQIPLSNGADAPSILFNGLYLFPVSGYSVWWNISQNNDISQTVIAWAKHDGHGHKHADEGSVTWWSNGVDWLTNTGYWPYGDSLTDASYGWTASNAQHEINESSQSKRTVRALMSGCKDGIRFIEIERINSDGAKFNRQVIGIESRLLIIVDFSSNAHNGSEIIWTTAPVSNLYQYGFGQGFVTNPPRGGRKMNVTFASPNSMDIGIYRGETQPFAGWVAVKGKPTPTDALRIVLSEPDSTVASLFRITEESDDEPATAILSADASPEQWSLTIRTGADDTITLSRVLSELKVRSENDRNGSHLVAMIGLDEIPPVDAMREKLARAYEEAIGLYPQWRDLTYYRIKLSALLVMLGIIYEVAYAIAIRKFHESVQRNVLVIHALFLLGWLLIGIWATSIYLQ
ncbi:MAG: heparinase II/III domain-containing protein [Pseudomonadota bacterium]